MRGPGRLACAAVGLACAAPSRALAYDVEVTGTTAAQGYEVASPWGDVRVARRRFVQTLGLGVYDLQGERVPGGPQLSARLRVRLDADFGIERDEYTYDPAGRRFVPGLAPTPVDLMYGYVEGSRLAGGWLGFRLGRQYVVDSLGFWSFDGALVRVTSPAYVQVEAYGGFEQRGGLPLSTSRYERGGVWRGDRAGYDAAVYPQFQAASSAPAWGVAAETAGLPFLHARIDYRKVWNQGTSVVQQIPEPTSGVLATTSGTRVSSERVGASLDATLARVGAAQAGVVYDLYAGLPSSVWASVDAFATRSLDLGADVDFFRPTFDGDSIWNAFASGPTRTLTGRARLTPHRSWDVSASVGARGFSVEGDPGSWQATRATAASPGATTELYDGLATLRARLRLGATRAGLHASGEAGERGRREGGDVTVARDFLGGRWTADARVSVYEWKDAVAAQGATTSFAWVVGGAVRPSELSALRLEFEHDVNRLVGQRYRVLALLQVAAR